MELPRSRQELQNRWNLGEWFEFYFFYGHKPPLSGVDASCLSQWFDRSFTISGIEYLTAEHWMMAEKARLFGDTEMLCAILECQSPKEAKRFGRRVQDFDADTWDENKYEIVVQGNMEKFGQHQDLRSFLLATANYQTEMPSSQVAEAKTEYTIPFANRKDLSLAEQSSSNVILVEAAGRDVVWGIGYGIANPKSRDPNHWRGHNLLGFALTEVREKLAEDA